MQKRISFQSELSALIKYPISRCSTRVVLGLFRPVTAGTAHCIHSGSFPLEPAVVLVVHGHEILLGHLSKYAALDLLFEIPPHVSKNYTSLQDRTMVRITFDYTIQARNPDVFLSLHDFRHCCFLAQDPWNTSPEAYRGRTAVFKMQEKGGVIASILASILAPQQSFKHARR
jgi:hypothetical protein